MEKILINFLYWGERESGLFRVGYNIIKNLTKIAEEKLFCLTNYYQDLNFPNLEIIPQNLKTKRTILRTIQAQFYLSAIQEKIKADLVFSPFHYGILFKKTNQIATIHDLIHMTIFKRKFISYFYQRFILKNFLKNCRFIITPSQATKEELIKFFNVNEEKIKVIYWGIEDKFRKLNLEKKDYFLVVNPSFPYKNVHYVIESWKKFGIEDKLVIVGYSFKYVKYYHYLKNLVKKLNLEDKILFDPDVSDEKLIKLYNQAKGLISASLKEGFNIPPLEALACGTPVILSDIPVHREIYGAIGIFFDLNKEESFLNALNQVKNLNNEDFEKRRIEFLKKFDWQKTTEEIYKIMKECIKE